MPVSCGQEFADCSCRAKILSLPILEIKWTKQPRIILCLKRVVDIMEKLQPFVLIS